MSEQHVYAYTADGERVLDWKLGGGAGPAPRELWTIRDLGGNVLREFRFVKPPADGGNGFAADAVTTDGDPDDSIFADNLEGAGVTGWDETSTDSSAATAVALRYWEIRDYVYRDSLLLGSITNSLAGGTVVWHDHLDHLGTPRLITDAQGNVVARHDYLPYGEEVTFAGEGDTKKFTGHQRDAFRLGFSGDDLDYMHARSYSGMLGRFTSVDPIGGNPLAPQSWNRYSYVLGNPLKLIDPSGLNECPTDDCMDVVGQDPEPAGEFDENSFFLPLLQLQWRASWNAAYLGRLVDHELYMISRPILMVGGGAVDSDFSRMGAGILGIGLEATVAGRGLAAALAPELGTASAFLPRAPFLAASGASLAGKCPICTHAGLLDFAGSAEIRAPGFNHYATRLVDGSIADPSLRDNLLAYSADVGGLQAGEWLFSAARWNELVSGFPSLVLH